MEQNSFSRFGLMRELRKMGRSVTAVALVRGSADYPQLLGVVAFSPRGSGTMVDAEITGLPIYEPAKNGAPPVGPFGFHIHEHGDCAPHSDGAFSQTGGHYNPDSQPHGNHAGDFPVLFSEHGYALMSFYTDRFHPADIIGRAVVIHLNPDDYRTQPAGGSGERIGCGVINRF